MKKNKGEGTLIPYVGENLGHGPPALRSISVPTAVAKPKRFLISNGRRSGNGWSRSQPRSIEAKSSIKFTSEAPSTPPVKWMVTFLAGYPDAS